MITKIERHAMCMKILAVTVVGSELKGARVGRLRGLVLSSCWTELLSLVTAMRVWSVGFPPGCKCDMRMLRSATSFIKAVMYSCEGRLAVGYVESFGTPDFVPVATIGYIRTKMMRQQDWRGAYGLLGRRPCQKEKSE